MKSAIVALTRSYPIIIAIWVLILSNFITVLSSSELKPSKRAHQKPAEHRPASVFDTSTATNVTVQLGTHAYLPCKISPSYMKQLGNKSVSWIRQHDAHILTVDRYTFIADERFQAFFVEGTDTWTLQVKYVQSRDAGLYECQISTEPKMSHFIQLNVVVPKTEIVGKSELYVKAGSTVSLRCVITRSLEEPAYIFWYRDSERVLNYDRSLIDIRMERIGSDTTVGQLTIYNTKRKDSGNYSCTPSNLDSASVILHVLNGEQPAAMQHGNAGWRVSRRDGMIHFLALAGLTFLVIASHGSLSQR